VGLDWFLKTQLEGRKEYIENKEEVLDKATVQNTTNTTLKLIQFGKIFGSRGGE
jgi:hypothetical protein